MHSMLYNISNLLMIDPLPFSKHALNGTAQSHGYRNIHDITKSYQEPLFGAMRYKDVGVLIDRGMSAHESEGMPH